MRASIRAHTKMMRIGTAGRYRIKGKSHFFMRSLGLMKPDKKKHVFCRVRLNDPHRILKYEARKWVMAFWPAGHKRKRK